MPIQLIIKGRYRAFVGGSNAPKLMRIVRQVKSWKCCYKFGYYKQRAWCAQVDAMNVECSSLEIGNNQSNVFKTVFKCTSRNNTMASVFISYNQEGTPTKWKVASRPNLTPGMGFDRSKQLGVRIPEFANKC